MKLIKSFLNTVPLCSFPQRPVVVQGDLQLGVASTVNGVDVVNLNRTVLSLYGDQTIRGHLVCDLTWCYGEVRLRWRGNAEGRLKVVVRVRLSYSRLSLMGKILIGRVNIELLR